MFAPNLSLTVSPDPDLLLLDSYIRLVEAKTIDDNRHCLQPAEQQILNAAVDRALLLARQKYGDKQAERVTKLGEERGLASNTDEERDAKVHNGVAALERALEGQAPSLSEALRTRLERYCWLAGGYYVDVNCKHLSKRQRYAFWQAVVERHNDLLYHTMLGTTEAKHAAETAPDVLPGCGGETRAYVRAAYKEIRSAESGALRRFLDRWSKA